MQTPIGEISFNEEESVLHIKINEFAEMNLENTKIHYKMINELVKDRPYVALVEASNYYAIDKEAWKYASLNEVVSNRKAVAHYNPCLANRLTTSFFLRAYSSCMPVKLFNAKQEALEWLKEIYLNSKIQS